MQLTEKVWAKNNWHYFLKNKNTMKEIFPEIKRTSKNNLNRACF